MFRNPDIGQRELAAIVTKVRVAVIQSIEKAASQLWPNLEESVGILDHSSIYPTPKFIHVTNCDIGKWDCKWEFDVADVFDRVSDWLQKLAFFDGNLEELVEQFSQRLIDGGIPVTRVSLGRLLMHPVMGMVDVTWDAESHRVEWTVLPRNSVTDDLFTNTPFGENTILSNSAMRNLVNKNSGDAADEMTEIPFIHANLTDPAIREKYPIYRKLAASGITDYLAFSAPFGMRTVTFDNGTECLLGVSVSYATKRRSGFTRREMEGLNRLTIPLFVTTRVLTEQFLAAELMEVYLGRISGQSVLNGQISRGDVREIDCALVFSDIHGSTAMSQRLSSEEYVAAVNRYFDCVAGAVQDHGGEVLKFVGDGLLAIFPFDGRRRLPEDMCRAALSASKEAFRRNSELDPKDRVDFGIALHMGAAVYGNVGTEKRLDFTVTGSSVALVNRLEHLTRDLKSPILATSDFAALVPDKAIHSGKHKLRGFSEAIDVVAFEQPD